MNKHYIIIKGYVHGADETNEHHEIRIDVESIDAFSEDFLFTKAGLIVSLAKDTTNSIQEKLSSLGIGFHKVFHTPNAQP